MELVRGRAACSRHALDVERLERRAQARDVRRIAVRVQLGGVRAVGEDLAHEPREDEMIGPRPDREVIVGEGGGLGAPRVEHEDPAAAGPEVAEAGHRVGERRPVSVRHDGVRPEQEQQRRSVRVPHGVELAGPRDELGGAQHRRVVDRDGRVALARPDPPEQTLGGHPPVDVVRETRREIAAHRVGSVLRGRRPHGRGEIVEHVVPRRNRAAQERLVETIRPVVPVGQCPSLRARVAP